MSHIIELQGNINEVDADGESMQTVGRTDE